MKALLRDGAYISLNEAITPKVTETDRQLPEAGRGVPGQNKRYTK
jgi:hypothetical protein